MKLAWPAFMLSLLIFSVACSEKRALDPIIVRVFRDPASKEIESTILALGQMSLKTSKGHPILIATLEPRTYAEGLEHLANKGCQLIVFNSQEDAKKVEIEIPPQSLLEVSTRRYFIVVPNWVAGEEREAAQIVSANFSGELSKSGNSTKAQ